MTELDAAHDAIFRKQQGTAITESIHATANAPQIVQVNQPFSQAAAMWFSIGAAMAAVLALALALVALSNSNQVAEAAASAARAQAKAETATARANVSEIYSKQIYTELNRLGYPVKTPAEEHAPQPSDNVSPEPK